MQCAPRLHQHPPALSLSRASSFFSPPNCDRAQGLLRLAPASGLLEKSNPSATSVGRLRSTTPPPDWDSPPQKPPESTVQWLSSFFSICFSFFLLVHFFPDRADRDARPLWHLWMTFFDLWYLKKTHPLLLALKNCNLKASGLEKFFFRVRCSLTVLHNLSVHRCSNHSRSTVPPVHHPPP